jgi:DNA-binding transcriptional LysR family regulator
VGEVGWVVVASPKYLEAMGQPRKPAELHDHDLIVASAGEFQLSWRFKDGHDIRMRVQPRLKTTTNDAAIEAALRGVGIARLLSYQVADDIKQGTLVPLLRGFEPNSIPVIVIHREGRHGALRIRAFIDLLVSSLRDTADL